MTRLEPPKYFLSDLTLALTVVVCSGSSRSKLETCAVTTQPAEPSKRAAVSTVRITAGVRPTPQSRSLATTGFRRNVRKIASATGIKIDCASKAR